MPELSTLYVTPRGKLREERDLDWRDQRGAAETWFRRVTQEGVAQKIGVSADGWRVGTTSPEYPGTYERLFTDGLYLHFWDGTTWITCIHHNPRPHRYQRGGYPCWRLLTQDV